MTQGSQFEVARPGATDQTKTDVAKAQGQQVADTAKQEVASVAGDAKQEGQRVAETAKAEVKNVADTAGTQARRLMDQAKSELSDNAGTQQQRLAGSVRSLADELDSMVRGNTQTGPVNDLAGQAAGKAKEVATWLESREPGDLLDDVRRFAARKPGLFLALAAGAGLVAGRLTRGLTADSPSTQSPAPVGQGQRLASTPPPVTGGYVPQHASAPGEPYAPTAVPGEPYLPGQGRPQVQQPGLQQPWTETGSAAPGQLPSDPFGQPGGRMGDGGAR